MQASRQIEAIHMMQPKPLGLATVSPLPRRDAVDAALLTRIKDGQDRVALAEIAAHYAPRLKGWLINRGVIAATAEDLVQDVLIKVWSKAGQFDASKASFSTWIYRLTRNQWIDHKRKYDRLQPTSPEILQVLADRPVAGVDEDYDQAEAAGAVNKALAELPPETKNMLHMSFFEGLSHGQIAERTGLPLGTVKSRIRAPLKRLQTRLADYREHTNDN